MVWEWDEFKTYRHVIMSLWMFISADSLSHLYLLHVKPEGKQVSELASFLSHAEYVSVWNGPSIQTTSMEWDQ